MNFSASVRERTHLPELGAPEGMVKLAVVKFEGQNFFWIRVLPPMRVDIETNRAALPAAAAPTFTFTCSVQDSAFRNHSRMYGKFQSFHEFPEHG